MTTAIADPASSARKRTSTRRAAPRLKRSRAPYLFIAPFYVLYVLFMLVPVLVSLWLSLTEWVGLGTPQWVGLRNYRLLATDVSFHRALGNTGVFVMIAVFVVVPLALLIAQALNTRGLRVRDLWRTAYFVPIVVSPIIVALIFGLIFDRQFGLLNSVLRALFGTGGVDWLGDPDLAKVSIGLVMLWRWTGYLTVFFLAGLQAVPKELYEAAALDGAGRIRTFTTVTLPALKPVTAFVVVTSFIGAAQIFEEPYLLTGGGPAESTLSVTMFIYRAAFQRQQFGYAAAAAVVLFVLVFGLSQLFNRLLGIGRATS
ncbi:carbohydrate ABC transporter permease [Streptomyces umbrinus]|uniref:carbohydrate ABC transporter permease n=1 Tax=Streptomyces umbrinus TaxID=67370 RepID=UPI00167DC7CD|nr:sugar ABC transporter permease [Streptomyces umbrinus]MCR3729154.1 multiple sugar transport system permease protein/lactose/L-arabinose transport system permease protein/cellobiose transport system permease protein [Streptomyces umbrinus]GHH36532.1 cytochrome c biogenesis protein [Streptomyces umbrinus]